MAWAGSGAKGLEKLGRAAAPQAKKPDDVALLLLSPDPPDTRDDGRRLLFMGSEKRLGKKPLPWLLEEPADEGGTYCVGVGGAGTVVVFRP